MEMHRMGEQEQKDTMPSEEDERETQDDQIC